MLAIRLQRTGRKGLANYRLIVQDSSRTPTSGKVVAYLGHYNPHTKELVVDKEKAEFYLKNGAQPSERAAMLVKKEGVKLPSWVEKPTKHKRTTRNPEKLRKNQPKEEVTEGTPAEQVVDQAPAEEKSADEAPAENKDEKTEEPKEEPAKE